jgi:hypothetical protein
MKNCLTTTARPEIKIPVISLCCALMIAGTTGFPQDLFALDEVSPGTTAYFDSAEASSQTSTDDCVSGYNCGGSATSTKAGVYAFLVGTTTQRARQTRVLRKAFSIPESDVGNPPENTVLDARVTGNVKWRGTLWTLDLSTLGTVTFPALGPTADAYIRVALVDVTDPNQPFEVGNEAIADFHCDPIDRELGAEIPVPLVSDGVELEVKVGWCEENSEDTFNFGAKVIQGQHYELQLTMICQAITGAVPTLLSACSFNDTPISYNLETELKSAFSDLSNSSLTLKVPDIPVNMPDATFPLVLPEAEIIGIERGDIIDTTIDISIPNTSIPGFIFEIDFSDVLGGAVAPIITSLVDALIPSIDDGYLEWDYMTVTIDPDITGLLRSTKNEILGEVGLVRDDLEIVRKGVGQSINLLHTPQGQRETKALDGYPDLCGDGDCDWGEGK